MQIISYFQYAEEKQAELEVNIFDPESAVKSEDTSEGQKLIEDFLRKCKEINDTISSDEEMLQAINKLKQELLNQNNKYIKSLTSVL